MPGKLHRLLGTLLDRQIGKAVPANAMPKVLGVSSPSGMAVTSSRPVRWARRKAIQV
jgi:hypothetical protein